MGTPLVFEHPIAARGPPSGNRRPTFNFELAEQNLVVEFAKSAVGERRITEFTGRQRQIRRLAIGQIQVRVENLLGGGGWTAKHFRVARLAQFLNHLRLEQHALRIGEQKGLLETRFR